MIFRVVYMVLIFIGIITNTFLAFTEQDDIAAQNILLWILLMEMNTLNARKL